MLEAKGSVFAALKSAGTGSAGLFDCPLCGGVGDLHVSIHASENPNYLFRLVVAVTFDPT